MALFSSTKAALRWMGEAPLIHPTSGFGGFDFPPTADDFSPDRRGLRRRRTTPSMLALSGCSIFIASSTTSSWPLPDAAAFFDQYLDDGAIHRRLDAADPAPAALLLTGW